MVHRIHRACSTPENFNNSIKKAKSLLHKNQYPPSFYEPIIEKTIEKITNPNPPQLTTEKEDEPDEKKFYVRYRGKITDQFEKGLKRIKAPVKVIMTTRKLKSVLP